MKKKSSNHWEIIRQKGKTHFVIKNGVLLWGIPVAIFWSIFSKLMDPSDNLLLHFIIAIPVFAIAGYLWALWTWYNNEKKYPRVKTNPN